MFLASSSRLRFRRGEGQPPGLPRPSRGSVTGSSRGAAKVEERLANVHERLRRARANERVLAEQVAYLREVVDEAETRKLVAQTPLADRAWQAVRADLERHARLLGEARAEVEELARERDRLLDRLLEVEGRST
ncbi:MAG: hypothetical protein M3O70_17400, partial [Actinomycetota bacterium]|nr:hypothetical protein [Actinomycetota bacterium]